MTVPIHGGNILNMTGLSPHQEAIFFPPGADKHFVTGVFLCSDIKVTDSFLSSAQLKEGRNNNINNNNNVLSPWGISFCS